MRVGCFELEYSLNERFTLPEVLAEQARVFKSFHIRNVRGSDQDWLTICVEVGGIRSQNRAVRHLKVNDAEMENQYRDKIEQTLVLPKALASGVYDAKVLIIAKGGEDAVLDFKFEVLNPEYIPTDFARARFLASWINTDDELRDFAVESVGEGLQTAGVTLHRLYESLLERELKYQPVSTVTYEDHQQISSTHHTISSGGSCTELSLLFASLLWNRGLAPALILFNGHMAAGCFNEHSVPENGVITDGREIAELIRQGKLVLVETTGVTTLNKYPFNEAITKVIKKIEDEEFTCCLVNVKTVLRTLHLPTIRVPEQPTVECSVCGCRFSASLLRCPACQEEQQNVILVPDAAQETLAAYEIHPDNYDFAALSFGMSGSTAEVLKLNSPQASEVHIPPLWRDRSVRKVRDKAFENTAIELVSLPETVQEIGDRAFAGCKNMGRINLPANLKTIGTAAFMRSGLTIAQIPGSVKRISRMAFSNCEKLERVVLEEGLQQIDERAFEHCTGLKTVTIPKSVKEISSKAFDHDCQLFLLSDITVIR